MSNWKEKRNYWKVKDCHGKVISHIIKIGDQQIEVSEEVFRCYSQGDRRERYILQDQKKSRFLSIEKLIQDEVKEPGYLHRAGGGSGVVTFEGKPFASPSLAE